MQPFDGSSSPDAHAGEMYTFVAMVSRKILLSFLIVVVFTFSSEANSQRGFVHTSGADLVDAANHRLMLRGINLGNWLEPEGYMFHFDGGPQSPREIEDLTVELIGPDKAAAFWRQWRETYITEADIDRIKKEGFNSVRVPIHWKLFDSDDAEGFRLLDRLVQWARKDGIYVIIDLHCAPGGQTGTNIDDSGGYPWLYSSPEAQTHTIAIWRRIAAHIRTSRSSSATIFSTNRSLTFRNFNSYNKDLEPFYRRHRAGNSPG